MNIKRYLKQQAKEDLKNSETEEDRAFLQRLKDSVPEQPPKKQSRRWLWAVPSVAACAVAVVLTVVLVPFPGKNGGTSEYEEANFVQVDSDFSSLSSALNKLTVCLTPDQSVEVDRTYDSVSGDDLFYTLTVDVSSASALYSLTARIVVNEKYEFDFFNVTEDFITETYASYSVAYFQTVEPGTGLNLVKCSAKISGADYDIYVIKYEEYSLDNGTFLTVIGNLFRFG